MKETMDIVYHHIHSRLLDYLYFPLLVFEKDEELEWDMIAKAQELLVDATSIKEQIVNFLLPYKERVRMLFLARSNGGTLPCGLYFYLLIAKKQDLTSIDALLTLFRNLTEEEIRKVIVDMLLNEERMLSEKEFYQELSQSSLSAEEKWYFLQAYESPVQTVSELSDLLEELVPQYTPFYERYETERTTFVENFDLERFLLENHRFKTYTDMLRAEGNHIELIVLSPWLVRFMMTQVQDEDRFITYVLISTRMEKILMLEEEIDVDVLTTNLKTISDATRYQVLLEIVKPHAKSKDIAEKIGITAAAVTFHTQKLINANLIIPSHHPHQKYEINTSLMEKLLNKLQQDLIATKTDE